MRRAGEAFLDWALFPVALVTTFLLADPGALRDEWQIVAVCVASWLAMTAAVAFAKSLWRRRNPTLQR